MRIAVSGSHSTGKSTLIAAFLARCPRYLHEPEAFETLGDDIELTESGQPAPEGLRALLEYTIAGVDSHALHASVVFERSPVDYLAYAAASRGRLWKAHVDDFLSVHVPMVRTAIRGLDAIAYLPVSPVGPAGRPHENGRFRERVDEALRRALLDDEYDLFGDRAPAVIELPPDPERQLVALLRLARAGETAKEIGG